MKIKITEAQLRALRDFAGGRDDFEILFKKVLYRVKNGSSVRDALTDLNVNSRLFYDNLSDEQKYELRSERTAWGITSKTSSVNNKTIPKIKGLSDIRHHKDMMDFLNADKEEYDDNDDLMEESVIDVASELPEVIKIIITMIIHRKIDNVTGLFDAISKGDVKTATQILTIGPDIREDDRLKLKTFFNNSESKKYMNQIKNELVKNPYVKKAVEYAKTGIDYLKSTKEKISSVVSENQDKIKIDLTDLRKKLSGKFENKKLSIEGLDSPITIEYVTPIFNYIGGQSLVKKPQSFENYIDFTFFDGEKDMSLIVDVMIEGNRLIAKPEIYIVSDPNAVKVDRSKKVIVKDFIEEINSVLYTIKMK